jgi:hypothetical protein
MFELSSRKGQAIYVPETGHRITDTGYDASEREVHDYVIYNRFTLYPIIPSIPDALRAPREMNTLP